MAITGIPPNGGGGGAPPLGHHVNVFWHSTYNGTGPPYCANEKIVFGLCASGGSCYMDVNASPNIPAPNGYGAQYPIGLGNAFGGNSTQNSWGILLPTSVHYQLLDANGIGVEWATNWVSLPNTSSYGIWGLNYTNSVSPLSNANPGFSDSHIYQTTAPPILSAWYANAGSMPTTQGQWGIGNYEVPFGNYTFKIWDMEADCYHSNSPVSSTNPSVHSIPIGQGNLPGNTFSFPITITDSPGSLIQTNWNGQGWSGCGPQPASNWLCHGDYRCEEIGVQGGISDYDAMLSVWNIAKNMWGVGRSFGWTESRFQSPPDGATHVESDQSVDLTRPGEILDGLQPYTIQTVNLSNWFGSPIWQTNQIPNTNISLSQYISVLPKNIGAAIPDMPVNQVSNTWTISNNVPPGGVTTYNPLNPNHSQASFWNPSPNATPGPNMVGGITSYRGVVEPPTGATNAISFSNGLHGTPNWNPFHDTLSSCIACCGDVYNQFDENGVINPYYGPYMTPPGWNDPNLNTPSNNQDFEDWLDGTNNPWGIPLPRKGYQVSLYKFYNGINMCGGTWIF